MNFFVFCSVVEGVRQKYSVKGGGYMGKKDLWDKIWAECQKEKNPRWHMTYLYTCKNRNISIWRCQKLEKKKKN